MAFSFLLQVVLLGMGKTLLSFAIPLYFSIIFRGTSNRRIFDSVLVFFLRVIIHKLPSKKVCRLSVVRFLTSEYANPREHRKQKQVPHKLVGLVGHLGIHHGVYLLFRDIPPVHAFGRVDIPAKGLNGRRPSFLAMEMMCFNTII
mgnify:CR=1 FL=1